MKNDELDLPRKDKKSEKETAQFSVNDLPAYTIPSETLKSLQAASNAIYKSVNIPRIAPDIQRILDTRALVFDKILSSAAFRQSITTVNQSIARLIVIEEGPYFQEILKASVFQEQFFQSEVWKNQQAILSEALKNSVAMNNLAWKSHLLDISKFATLSDAALSQIPFENLGNALEISNATRDILKGVFLDFSESYSALYDSLEKQPSIITELPSVVSRLPAIEFFNGVMVIDRITLQEDDDQFIVANRQTVEETERETEDRLEFLLARLNPEFIVPLQGARQSVSSSNPDHIRHFSTSLRELFTHVLHTVAPDEKVEKWNNDPQNYDKGKLTRRARLRYICRSLDNNSFSVFIKKDIDALLAFLDLFQEGTHEIASNYTDAQLEAMLLRMESSLRYILEISHLH